MTGDKVAHMKMNTGIAATKFHPATHVAFDSRHVIFVIGVLPSSVDKTAQRDGVKPPPPTF